MAAWRAGRRRGLTRRQILIGGGVLGAAALGITSTGSPFSGGAQTVSFWHLFGGGDGERLTGILADIESEHADSDVRELILPWGNPYYTKLALAAVGGSPPDVAVVHATRLPSFAPAGLLEELTPELLARHGLEGERFLEEPWKSGQSGGKQYAIPLDTHPFVLYYNTELCEKAGLLEGGKLAALDGRRRAARRLPGDQGGDRQDRARVRDARRDAVADLPDPLQPARRPADPRGRRHPDRHGRRDRDQGAPVDGGAAQARRRRARRRLPGLGGVLRQRDRRLRAQRRVGGHHLPGHEDEVRHADGADDLRQAPPTRPTRTPS